MSLYRIIFLRSLRMIWSHKYLWFFGLFATFIWLSEYKIIANGMGIGANSEPWIDWGLIASTGVFSLNTFYNIMEMLRVDTWNTVLFLLLLLIVLVLFIFIIWMAVSSQVAIIRNSATLFVDEKKGSMLGVRDGISTGAKFFWPAFVWNLISRICVYLLFYITSLVLIFSSQVWLYVLVFVIFIPVAVTLSLIIKYAIGYIVIKKENFINSIGKAWKMFINNWMVSVEMAVALFMINFLASALILLVAMIVAIPFLFVAVLFYQYLTSLSSALIISGIGGVAIIAVIVLAGSALTSFQISSWSCLFVRLDSGNARSKIERIFDKKKNN